MNREIKFRAWGMKRQFMFMVHTIIWKLGKILHIKGVASVHGEVGGHADYIDINKDLILMQYTGLKDKNSKEIYEGDIISVKSRWGDFIGEVHFRQGSFYHTCIEIFDGKKASHRPSKFVSSAVEYDCEVIGNIYENPELL